MRYLLFITFLPMLTTAAATHNKYKISNNSPVSMPVHKKEKLDVSIDNKIIAGYQGWYVVKGDGSPRNAWIHWVEGGGRNDPTYGNIHVDSYPDVRDYDENELFSFGLNNLGNGEPSRVYSPHIQSVVDKQFQWMMEYGIDGAAIQRYPVSLREGGIGAASDIHVVELAKNACEKTDKIFYIMYAIERLNDADIYKTITEDWEKQMIGRLKVTESPNYAIQDGKPVVMLWGLGFSDTARYLETAEGTLRLINYFKKQGCYVGGGVPFRWRLGTRDSKPGFLEVYKAYDFIMPWAAGRMNIDNVNSAEILKLRRDDKAFCDENNILYQPAIFPGISQYQYADIPDPNRNKRMYGDFMWQQAINLYNDGNRCGYFGMWDEYDESTAIIKMAEDFSMIPADHYFLTTSADGVYLSSDFYLRLSGKITKLFKGEAEPTPKHGVPYSEGPVYFRSSFEEWTDAISQNELCESENMATSVCETVFCEQSNRGAAAVKLSGKTSIAATAATQAGVVYESVSLNVPVQNGMKLAYSAYAVNDEGKNIRVSLRFSDGTYMQETAKIPSVGGWQHIIVNVSPQYAGKTIGMIVFTYKGNASGAEFTAYIDDVILSTNINEIEKIKPYAEGEPKNYKMAKSLYDLGLFKGSNTARYVPKLDAKLIKEEAVTQILTLLGLADQAKKENNLCSFTDVSERAKPYIGYAQKIGMIPAGGTVFNAAANIKGKEYLTFFLKLLDYEIPVGQILERAIEAGLLNDAGDGNLINKEILMDDAIKISYRALAAVNLRTNKTMMSELVARGVVTRNMFHRYLDTHLIKVFFNAQNP